MIRGTSPAGEAPYPLGAANEGPPHAIVQANTRYFEAGPLTVGLEYRVVNDEVRAARAENPSEFQPLGTEFRGFSIHVIEAATGVERLRFDHFPGQWHYHYLNPPHDNIRVGYDEAALGPMLDWSLTCLTTRLPQMLTTAGAAPELVDDIDPEAIGLIVDDIKKITTPASGHLDPGLGASGPAAERTGGPAAPERARGSRRLLGGQGKAVKRLGRGVRLARQELASLRERSRASGGRDAVISRSKELLGLDELAASSHQAEREARSVEARLSARLDELESRMVQGIARLDAEVSVRLGELGTDIVNHTAGLREGVDRTVEELDLRLEGRLREAEKRMRVHAQVATVTAWVADAEVATRPLISVVLATRNRSELLRRAIASVRAQIYPHWELVVIDDESTDETPTVLQELSGEDERILVIRGPGRGVSAARNAGLSAAHGEIVCYADDDNVMQPLWLKAVAWAFERHPDADVVYGARIADTEQVSGPAHEDGPYLHFEQYDRHRMEVGNRIDLGVLAHRSNLSEAIFDETLESLVDWDLILRLTAERPPLALPVVASHYSTSAPGRISEGGSALRSEAAVRAKLLRDRPMKVLAYNALFPLLSETYIGAEMRALAESGAELAWCTDHPFTSPVRVAEPQYMDFDKAVAEFDPDLVFVFWATQAVRSLDALERAGKPFALRVHSFDFDLPTIEKVRTHPLCLGIWAFPHHARLIDGAHRLVPLLTERDTFPQPTGDRTVVLSTAAGLPKRDWPTLVDAYAELCDSGVDCRIIVARTQHHEEVPDLIRQLIADSGAPIMLSIDVPHDQVIALLARTAAVVYTKVPDGPFGMPRSVIEGMYAGTSVILPERPESMLTAGPDCRTYHVPHDIVHHANEILAGGPAIDAERRANRQLAEARFADPALDSEFAAQVSKALARWRSD